MKRWNDLVIGVNDACLSLIYLLSVCLVPSYSEGLQILLSSIMMSNPQERPNINWVLDQVQDLQSRSPSTQTNMVWSCTVHWMWETFAHINERLLYWAWKYFFYLLTLVSRYRLSVSLGSLATVSALFEWFDASVDCCSPYRLTKRYEESKKP